MSSSRRMAVPGPVDNLWMLSVETGRPYEDLVEDTDDCVGDYRRVTPQVLIPFIDGRTEVKGNILYFQYFMCRFGL